MDGAAQVDGGPTSRDGAGTWPLTRDDARLRRRDGSLFPWVADTAWELVHRATPAELSTYLDDRVGKGFSVVQTVLLAELEGATVPDHAGHLPLVDLDPAMPDPGYLANVHRVVTACRDRGLAVALMPTWGSYVTPMWRPTPPLLATPAAAAAFGRWVGGRLGRHDNVVWVLGGDRPAVGPDGDHRPVWDAMAHAIRDTEGERHLMAYHPPTGSTSLDEVGTPAWLDLHMAQSGHGPDRAAPGRLVRRMRRGDPLRPCIDAEPCYEDHPVDFDPANGRFDADDVERAIRDAIEAGAAGFSYGAHAVWQWLDATREPVSAARGTWRTALGLPGSERVADLRRLLTEPRTV